MKVSCLQENLAAGLETVRHAVASRSTLPITQSVLLETDQGMLQLRSCNLEMAITTRIGAMVEAEGAVAVPFQVLHRLVTSMPSNRVDLDILDPDAEGDETPNPNDMSAGLNLRVQCGESDSYINCAEARDFPVLATPNDELILKVETEALRTAIGLVEPAASTEDSRPVLTAIHMTLDGDRMEMAAADGFRLSVYHWPVEAQHDQPIAVNVPSRTMQQVRRLLGQQSAPLRIAMAKENPSVVRFELEHTTIVSQLISGAFPNYAALIPDKYETKVLLETDRFHVAHRMATAIGSDNNIVRMEVAMNPDEETATMTVSARSQEVGSTQDKFVVPKMEGQNAQIAFNARYLSSLLSVAGKHNLEMELTSNSSPGVFRIAESDQFTHVVMPMHVQW